MLILPALHKKTASRVDRTWDLTFGTNELTPEQASEMVKLNGDFVYIAIKKDEFKPRDLEILAGIQSEFEFKEKPPGQRLQAVFYRLWEIDKQGYVDFHLYYRFQMEKLIEHFKTKLP